MNTRNRLHTKARRKGVPTLLMPMSLIAISIASGSAVAQSEGIEEVVVTAQHREQSIQDVPISISAFTATDIESNMFRDVTDFVGRTPNASFVSNGAKSRKEISMRGVTNFVGANSARRTSTFGFYIDGFNLSSSGSNPPIMDIERIEILRGPQSTYFGANAMGGGISVTSKAPSTEEFGGSVMVDYGSFNTVDVEGTLNIPLITDKLAARINYKDVSSDGNIENINAIGGGNDSEYTYFKGSLLWTPTDELTVAFNFADSDEYVGMREGVPTGVFSTFAGGTLFANFPDLNGDGFADPDPDGVGFYPENDDKVNFNSPQEVGTTYNYYIGKVDYDFETMLFSSITGYVESDYFLRGDIDGGSGDYFNEQRTIPRESFTQEFRLQSTTDSKLSWNVGAFFNDDEGYIDNKTYVGSAMIFGLPEGFVIDSEESLETSEGWAVFGQVDYQITDKLLLSVGGRYSEETIFSDISGFGGASVEVLQTESSFDDFSPKVALSYDLSDDASIYGSVAKGFKSGGVQLSPLPDSNSYDPEELWNYELGYKAEMFDRTLRVNVAAFYMDWTDLQTSFQLAGLDENGDFVIFGGIDNAESAESKGVELSITSVPMAGLELNFNVGYLDATYEKFVAYIDGENRVLDGRTIPNSPKLTVSADAEYNWDLSGSLEGFVRGEYQYRDDITSSTSALVQSGFPWEVPSYDVANLRFGVRNDDYSVAFYVENLFDADYYTNAYQKAFMSGLHVEPSVQRFGVKVRYNF